VPNQLSATAVFVAGAVPFVQYLGWDGARRGSQPQLQLYVSSHAIFGSLVV